MNRSALAIVSVCTSILINTAPSYAGVASFQGLGDLPDGFFDSYAFAVSADGSVVAGLGSSASIPIGEAMRWTADGGMVGLASASLDTFSIGYGISADGATVVGYAIFDQFGPIYNEAFRWTETTGMVSLGLLPGNVLSEARATSEDGSVVVGHNSTQSSVLEAFRWTETTGMVGLGDLPGGIFYSKAEDTSGDGSIVVGTSNSASGYQAFRWTEESGMEGLGHLPGGNFSSQAFAITADGTTIVGASGSVSGYEACIWTEGGGIVGLGDLPGGSYRSRAIDVSADGSVVLGYGTSASGSESFLWTANTGMRLLREILTTDHGLDLTGWNDLEAYGISADGRTIVGVAINPDGVHEAWVVTLPEPGTFALLSFAGMLCGVQRNRRSAV